MANNDSYSGFVAKPVAAGAIQPTTKTTPTDATTNLAAGFVKLGYCPRTA